MSELHPDYRYLYVFVRKDLPYSQIIVQSCHAVLDATRKFITDEARYKIVCLGIKSQTKLEKVIQELTQHSIRHVVFCEPDLAWEKTAIATEPLDASMRHLFSRYKLLQDD